MNLNDLTSRPRPRGQYRPVIKRRAVSSPVMPLHDAHFRSYVTHHLNLEALLLGSRVTLSRHAKGWTRKELAARSGISVPVIHKIESGHTLRPRRLLELSVCLDVNPAWLQFGSFFDESGLASPQVAQALLAKGPEKAPPVSTLAALSSF